MIMRIVAGTRILPIVLFLVLAIRPAWAQKEFGLCLIGGVPIGEFGEHVDRSGNGLRMHYATTATGGLRYGLTGFYQTINRMERTEYDLLGNLGLTTSNRIAGLSGMTRFYFFDAFLAPFLEGRLGFLCFFTDTKIDRGDYVGDIDTSGHDLNSTDLTYQYGYGGGIQIRVKNATDGATLIDDGLDACDIVIEVQTMATHGGEAKYIAEGDVEYVNNAAVVRPTRSGIDLFHLELGVVFRFPSF